MTWQAGWDAVGPCWAPSGKRSPRGAGGHRVDTVVPRDCKASLSSPCGLPSPPRCRTLPKTCMEKIVENVRKFNIQGLLVIGGFEVRGPWRAVSIPGGAGTRAIPFGMQIRPWGWHFPSPRLLAGV